jgi:hypothetical protein
VIQGLGLILEHVPAAGGPGSLRLFGGVPGQPAALMVGSAPGIAPGPGGTTRLVADGACVVPGTFDGTGSFSVPLADLPRELLAGDAYAQGLQAGQLAWGPIPREGHALSQGLHLAPATRTAAAPFDLSDLGSRLPRQRRDELDSAFSGGDLTAFLIAALDSDGDRVAVKLDGDAQVTVYPGVSLGAKAALEAVVARESAGAFSVSVERGVAMLASVGLGDFAGVEGAKGLAGRVVFTFPSAAGAARGVWGLWLAQNVPAGTTLPELPDRRPLELARQAWGAARAGVATAAARVASARAYVARAGGGRSGPIAAAARAAALPVLVAAQAVLRGAQQVEARSFGAMQHARAALEGALAGLWKAQRLLFEVDGARRYALLHADGGELTFLATGEFKLCLVGGVVTIQGNDVGFKAGMERAVAVRFGAARAGAPVPVEVSLRRTKSLEAWAGLHLGGRAALDRGLVARLAFEMGQGASAETTQQVSVEADAWARSERTVGLGGPAAAPGVVTTSGVGRKVAFTLPLEQVAHVAAAVEGDGGVLDALADVQGDLDLADYRVEGYVARYGLNVAGTGGSIGFQALVTDSGVPLDLDGVSARRVHGAVTQAAAEWVAPQP